METRCRSTQRPILARLPASQFVTRRATNSRLHRAMLPAESSTAVETIDPLAGVQIARPTQGSFRSALRFIEEQSKCQAYRTAPKRRTRAGIQRMSSPPRPETNLQKQRRSYRSSPRDVRSVRRYLFFAGTQGGRWTIKGRASTAAIGSHHKQRARGYGIRGPRQ